MAARTSRLPIELLIVADGDDRTLETAIRTLAFAKVPILRVIPVDSVSHATTPALAARARAVLGTAGLDAAVAAGTCGYLYQLLSEGVPDGVAAACYPLSPQVHATDEATIIESIGSVAAGVASVRHAGRGVPVGVGPISLRALCNPDDSDAPQVIGPDGLPGRYDARQTGLLTAAWSLGVAAALAREGAAWMTLHEAAGWGGLVVARHDPFPRMPGGVGTLLPVGHLASALAGFAGCPVLQVDHGPGLAVLGVRTARMERLVVANLEAGPTTVSLGESVQRRARVRFEVLGPSNRGWVWRQQDRGTSLVLHGFGLARVNLSSR